MIELKHMDGKVWIVGEEEEEARSRDEFEALSDDEKAEAMKVEMTAWFSGEKKFLEVPAWFRDTIIAAETKMERMKPKKDQRW